MAKLPDAGDLGNPNFRPARSFSNVPVADYQSAFGALGRGLSDVGEGAQRYAIEVDKRLKDEEAFGVNLRLADAQVQFSSTVSGLDPSDPEFAQKRMKAWSDTFKPIMDGIQHGENKRRFGEWAYENGAKIQIDSDRLALEANTGKTKLQLSQYIEQQKKLVADRVITPEQASANVKAQIAQAPNLFELDKQELLLKDATKFDADIVEMTALNDAGEFSGGAIMQALVQAESSGDPDAVSPKGAIGLAQVMPETAQEIAEELGDKTFLQLDATQRSAYLRRKDVSLRYGAHYLNKMLKRYGGDLEAALIAYNAGPGNADKWVEAGRNYEALPKPEETKPYVEKIFGLLGSDGSAPPTVGRRGKPEAAMISSLEANPVFQSLPVDQQNTVRENVRRQYRQQLEEQERLDIVAGTRSVVDYAVENYSDPEVAREYLREKIQDPLALEDGFALLDKEIAGRKQREEDRKTEMFKSSANKVIELRDAGKTNEALAAIPRDLDAEDREKLRKLALDGPATTDNAKVEGDLWAISYRDPEAFKAVDLTKYRGDLTQETLEKFAKVQEDLKKPGETTSIRTVGSMLDNYYEELGIKSSKDENDIRARNAIERQVGNQILTLEKQLGRKAEMNEIQEVLDTTFMTFSTPGDWWGSNQNSLKDVLGTMQETADEYAMPLDSLYDTAITDLTNNGYDPTPENINRWLGDYKKWRQQKVTPQ